jgi:hypothetical protein
VSDPLPPAPYPPTTRAKGWRFELDYEQIEQSETWALAKPEVRPWLLMLWLTAWRQVPCGSLSANPDVIAGQLGVPTTLWAKHHPVLMRGWWCADDGRLYHRTLTVRVQEMLARRRGDADRQARRRAALQQESDATPHALTHVSHVTPGSVVRESSTDNRQPSTEEEAPVVPRKKARTRKRAGGSDEPLLTVDFLVGEGVDAQCAEDWLAIRKGKRVLLTRTAWDDTKIEAAKAGLAVGLAVREAVTRGWAGFKAKWLVEDRPGDRRQQATSGERQRAEQEAAAEGARLLFGHPKSSEVIDGQG